jgi:hypothetical protein
MYKITNSLWRQYMYVSNVFHSRIWSKILTKITHVTEEYCFHSWVPWQGRRPIFRRSSTAHRQIASTVSCVGTWQQFGLASHSRLAHQYCCLGSLCFRALKFYEKNLRVWVSAIWLPEKKQIFCFTLWFCKYYCMCWIILRTCFPWLRYLFNLPEILLLTGTITDLNDLENQASFARPLLQSLSHWSNSCAVDRNLLRLHSN